MKQSEKRNTSRPARPHAPGFFLPKILQHHVTNLRKGDMKQPKQNFYRKKKHTASGFHQKSEKVLLIAFLGL